MRLLRAIDVCAQFLLLLPERSFFLASYRTTGQDHHDRFVPRLLSVSGTTRSSLLLLALDGAKLLPSLAPLLNRGYTLSIVRLRLLTRPKNVVFGDESLPWIPL